jgi:outer membrane protein
MGEINIPLYQGGAEDAAVRQAKELHGKAQLDVLDAQNQVRQAVASAYQSYLAAKATIVSNQATVKANRVAFEGVRREHQVGGRTTLDVLNAEQELLNSQVAVVASQRDMVVAAYQLLSAIGALTARGLHLDVHLYDPVTHFDNDAHRWIGLGD